MGIYAPFKYESQDVGKFNFLLRQKELLALGGKSGRKIVRTREQKYEYSRPGGGQRLTNIVVIITRPGGAGPALPGLFYKNLCHSLIK